MPSNVIRVLSDGCNSLSLTVQTISGRGLPVTSVSNRMGSPSFTDKLPNGVRTEGADFGAP